MSNYTHVNTGFTCYDSPVSTHQLRERERKLYSPSVPLDLVIPPPTDFSVLFQQLSMTTQKMKDIEKMVQKLILERKSESELQALPPENISIEWEPYSKKQVRCVIAKVTRGTWTAEDLEE